MQAFKSIPNAWIHFVKDILLDSLKLFVKYFTYFFSGESVINFIKRVLGTSEEPLIYM